AMVQVPGAAEVLDEPPADGVGVLSMRVRQVVARPRLGLARELCVRGLEERPGVVRKALHQSPWNSGLRLAANASKARWKSFVCMQIACACASISIASSSPTFHSWCSIFFVMACAKVGPAAS